MNMLLAYVLRSIGHCFKQFTRTVHYIWGTHAAAQILRHCTTTLVETRRLQLTKL